MAMCNKLHLTRLSNYRVCHPKQITADLFTIHTAAVIYSSRSSRYFLAPRSSDSMQLDLSDSQPTFTMPVFSELLFIMSLKDVKRFLKDSMKSASPLFS